MYLINKDENRIEKITQKSFSELGFKERENLQEWIAHNPSTFDEELLIIQKEFSGFNDTQERLDLLALDKQGNIVLIENKLDDSGKDVTWQSLKYASYCSSLSKDNIRAIYQDYLDKYDKDNKAEDKLFEFFDNTDYEDLVLNNGFTQRIILVAAKFRKEVTSTVLWLMNYKLQIQCFKVSPYSLDDKLFLNFEQIIPTKDAEDFMIGMAEKAHDDRVSQSEQKHRHTIRKEFWTQLLDKMNSKSNLFKNISPLKFSWISTGSGVSGISYLFIATRKNCRVELYIGIKNKEENKSIYDLLHKRKDKIEIDFNGSLTWCRLDNNQACKILIEFPCDLYERDQWDDMISFLTENMINLEKTFKNQIKEVVKRVKSNKI